jgi:1,4-alpha-glucan branching enzyme
MNDDLSGNDPLAQMAAALQQPVAVAPGLTERTFRRARRQAKARLIGATTSAAVACLALILILGGDQQDGRVTFAIDAPTMSGVSLVGDFTEWETDRVQLHRAGGRWEVTLDLPPGRYRFAYVTDDGQWIADQAAAPAPDDFGRPTSVLTVPN